MKCRKVSRLSTLDLSLQASRRCGGKSDICISPFEFIARRERAVEDWRWRGLDDNMSDNMGDNDGGLKLFWDYLDFGVGEQSQDRIACHLYHSYLK